jgi:hypothetical protein
MPHRVSIQSVHVCYASYHGSLLPIAVAAGVRAFLGLKTNERATAVSAGEPNEMHLYFLVIVR